MTSETLRRLYELNNITPTGEPVSPISAAASLQKAKTRRLIRKRSEQEQLHSEVLQEARAAWEKSRQEHRDSIRYIRENMPPPAGYVRGGTLVAQLSDLHFGAWIPQTEELEGFSMSTAARRLRLYACRILDMQLATGASDLVICLTGDLVDSRIGKLRLDKVANAESTQGLVMNQGADLILSFIYELLESEQFGSVAVRGVAGNEGRMLPDVAFGETTAPENFDCLLHAIVEREFKGSDVDVQFSIHEIVVPVEDERILLIHGHTFKHNNRTKMEQILLKHGATFGICGHIHEPLVTGNWARSASLCGTDAYASHGLQLSGRASQNLIHVQGSNRSVFTIDLERPGDIEPYPLHTYSGAFGVVESATRG